jgi:hypothetical protein
VRTRARGKDQTVNGLRTTKVVDIVSRYALLHAYGVGLDVFRQLPEQQRMRGIEYAKWMLAYALDDEIDSAYLFFKALHCDRFLPHGHNFVKVSYLEYMYGYWRQLSGTCERVVPIGAFIVGALLIGQRVFFTPGSKPLVYITVSRKRMRAIEDYLESQYAFRKWPEEEYRWSFKDEREDDVGNEPQGVDALENVKVEENG